MREVSAIDRLMGGNTEIMGWLMGDFFKSSRPGVPIDVEFCPVTFPWDCANGIFFDGPSYCYPVRGGAYIDYRYIRQLSVEQLNRLEDVIGICIQGWDSGFDFLRQCRPNLEHIWILLVEASNRYQDGRIALHENPEVIKAAAPLKPADQYLTIYDTEPLYLFESLKTLALFEFEKEFTFRECYVDLSRFKVLEKYCGEYRFAENLDKVVTLKSLELNHYSKPNLKYLSDLKFVDSLRLTNSNMQTLDGCEELPKLQCLYLFDNEELEDISGLRGAKNSLKALRIRNCNQIKDFSVLEELENLQLLELSGTNSIPSLSFIKKLKNLRTLEFSVDVMDNDLTPCFELEHVICNKRKLSYNHRFKSLPKIGYDKNGVPRKDYVKGNEDLEMWRRFE